MKLTLKSKSKTKKTVTKTETKKQKKINESYKHVNYTDVNNFKFAELDSTLNKLRYSHIIYSDVTKVNLAGDRIVIDNSWIGLILLMLDTIRVNHESDFLNYLMEKEITDQSFCVDRNFGKYSFDKDMFKAYNLYDSGYFVESTFTFEVVYKVIINMAKALGIKPDLMSLHLVHKEYSLNDIILEELEDKSTPVNIADAYDYFKDNIFLMDMSICNTHMSATNITGINSIMNITKVHHIQEVLMVFLYHVYDNYGDKYMNKLCGINTTTHVKTDKTPSTGPSMQIRDSKYSVYSDLHPKHVLEFIDKAMNIVKMDKDDIKLYFRRKKKPEELKEWEVD